MFEKLQERETSLTTVETFCMEIIYALDKPTVAQFADMANISSPNAAYKINNLVKKGYLKKVQSEEDKREYHLEVTQKYIDYYNISNTYLKTVMGRIEDRFSKEELEIRFLLDFAINMLYISEDEIYNMFFACMKRRIRELWI